MTVQSFLDISTIHQPRGNHTHVLRDYILAEGDEDLFLWVPDVESEYIELPDWFWNICKFAWRSGCYYIRFTPDGEIYDNLEKFDWE